jgi:hypothetical protein
MTFGPIRSSFTRQVMGILAPSIITLACGSQPSAPPAPLAETAPAEGGSATAAAPRPASSAPSASVAKPAPVAPAAPAPAPVPATIEVTIPAGTDLSIELLTDLSTETATVETAVRGRLRRAVMVGDRTAIPAGATLTGVVTEAERPGRVKGRGVLALRFTGVTLDGTRVSLPTRAISREGEADRKGDIIKVGGGAGVGAIVGGLIGGGDGAAKGAAIGGAAGTGALLATRGKDVELASGTVLSTSTSGAVTVELPR